MPLNRMVGFVTTARPDAALAFYRDVLGFSFVNDDGFALVFDANGTMLRVVKAKEHTPAQGTILGWQVDDLRAEIRTLTARGARFEQYGLPFMQQDELGIWTSPSGVQIAWLKDPDGNTLGLSQHVTA